MLKVLWLYRNQACPSPKPNTATHKLGRLICQCLEMLGFRPEVSSAAHHERLAVFGLVGNMLCGLHLNGVFPGGKSYKLVFGGPLGGPPNLQGRANSEFTRATSPLLGCSAPMEMVALLEFGSVASTLHFSCLGLCWAWCPGRCLTLPPLDIRHDVCPN